MECTKSNHYLACNDYNEYFVLGLGPLKTCKTTKKENQKKHLVTRFTIQHI